MHAGITFTTLRNYGQCACSNGECADAMVELNGPVKKAAGAPSTFLRFVLQVPLPGGGIDTPLDAYTRTRLDSGNRRRVCIDTKPGLTLDAGMYRVESTGQLVCADIPVPTSGVPATLG